MSSDDFIVDPLRDLEVHEHAKAFRRFLGWENSERIDPLALESVNEMWTVRGKKPFRLEVVSDAELPDDVFGAAGVVGHRVEEPLDQLVAGGVQDNGGPQASGLQA